MLHFIFVAFYTQDPITIIQVKICSVMTEDRMYALDQHIGDMQLSYIGFEYFYHFEIFKTTEGMEDILRKRWQIAKAQRKGDLRKAWSNLWPSPYVAIIY